MRQHSSTLIAEITEDQRTAIRETIEVGVAEGRNPRSIALDLVGRLEGGTRKGGIIGLTAKQAEYVRTARAQLLARDGEYFSRALRDKRSDGRIRRAFAKGEGLSVADADDVAKRYAERLLNHRAEVIARTEAIASLHAGQFAAMKQLIDSGKVRVDQVTKRWDATGDRRTRPTHAAMDGQMVRFDRPFVSPSGAMLMHPHDASLGATADEIIQCRCYMAVRVKYL